MTLIALMRRANSAPHMYRVILTSFLLLDNPSEKKTRLGYCLFTGHVFTFHYLLTQTKRVKQEEIRRHYACYYNSYYNNNSNPNNTVSVVVVVVIE